MIGTRAQRFRVRRWATERRLRLALLTLAVATILAAVLVTAAGAHRTATAPDRYAAAVGNGVDLKIEQEEGRPVTADIAGLPAVDSVEAFTFMFTALFVVDGAPLDSLAFAGTMGGAEARLVDGRAADPSQPGEFVATPSFVELTGLEIGDFVDTASLTTDDIQQSGFDLSVATGPRVRATLVGVMDGPTELEEPTPIVLFSPALLDEDVATGSTTMAVALAAGATRDDLQRQIDGLLPGNAFKIDPATTLSDDIRDRALGADRRWLVASEWWQAIVATLAPAAFDAAGGLVVGRLVYRAYADRRGVVTDPATPWALGLASIAGLVVLSVVVATLAGRRARRDHPAFVLRTG